MSTITIGNIVKFAHPVSKQNESERLIIIGEIANEFVAVEVHPFTREMKSIQKNDLANVSSNSHEVCCICGNKIKGYGHNTAPAAEGRCCDDCNKSIILPARMLKYENQ